MSLESASAIVSFVARLINDPGHEYHAPAEIYEALKRHRVEARYLALDALPTKAPGGVTSYQTFVTPDPKLRYFETDAVLYDHNYDELTPATSDYFEGRWTFETEPEKRPVMLVGFSHDPYGAAADLLEVRAAQVAEDLVSFQSLSGGFAYANKRSGPMELASKYRAMSRSGVGVSTIRRSDLA